jgi:phospholipase C
VTKNQAQNAANEHQPAGKQPGKIKHVVQLMLENRSFDQMLGFLYTDADNKSPAGDAYNGLTGSEFNLDAAGNKVTVFRIVDGTMPHPYLMPKSNPREGFEATNLQIYGVDPVPKGTKATMGGFVASFTSAIAYDQGRHEPDALPETKPSDIMGMYDPKMLPVMSALAKGFAVCDRWFSSVPTETFPNRAFACTGTSLGHLKDDFKLLNTPSIFGRLSDAGLDWAAFGYASEPYIRTDYPDTRAADRSKFGQFSDFQQRCKSGTLPAYTFLEPSWGTSGNSQHPVGDVALGEKLIYDVYQALRANADTWNGTLLIITYDEHGGNYDHVIPPGTATPPDDHLGDIDHFDFKRFGVRVPALLVSPWVKKGSVFRAGAGTEIDHTTVLATLRALWPTIKPLAKRDAAAPNLLSALTEAKPRADDPLAEPKVTPPSTGTPVPNANRPSKVQKLQAAKVASLHVPNEHGTFDHDQPDLKTSNEVAEYIRDRTAAWENHAARRRRHLQGRSEENEGK